MVRSTHFTCQSQADKPAAVDWLLQHGANPNAKSLGGITPLYLAVCCRSVPHTIIEWQTSQAQFNLTEVVKRLIAANANVNDITSEGATPLYVAVCKRVAIPSYYLNDTHSLGTRGSEGCYLNSVGQRSYNWYVKRSSQHSFTTSQNTNHQRLVPRLFLFHVCTTNIQQHKY